MDNGPGKEALLITFLSNEQIVRSLAASMAALVAYDICIFFSEEFRLVWNSNRSAGKFLYLYIRYTSLGLTLLGFYGVSHVNSNELSCGIITQLYTAWACTYVLAIEFTQLVKTVAPYSDNPSTRKRLFVCLGSAFVVIIGLSIKLVVSYEPVEYPFPGVPCPLKASFQKPAYITFYAFMVVIDIAMCIICLIKFFQLWAGGNRKFAMVIVRDSLVFTLVLTLLAIPQFLVPMLIPASMTILVTGLNYVIIAIKGIAYCRMILNLRSYLGHENISIGTFNVSVAIRTRDTLSEINFDVGDEIEEE